MGKGLSLADTAFLKNSGYSPASIAGLFRWWKASQYDGIAANGDNVGGGTNLQGPWLDNSGNGGNATVGANGPVYATNRFGSQSALEFAFSNPILNISAGTFAGDFTIVCVCQTPASDDSFIFYNGGNADQLRTQFFGSHDVVFYDGTAALSQNFGARNVEVVGFKRSSNIGTFRKNKTLFAGGATSDPWTPATIGSQAGTGGVITIAELIIYSGAVSETDLDDLYDLYLKPKFSVLP